MQDGHTVTEAGEELARHSRCERNLRHQQQRAAAPGQRGFDGAQIDLGLAGAGDAVQQERLKLFRLDGPENGRESFLLRGVERVARAHRARRHRAQRFAGEFQDAPTAERPRRAAGIADLCLQIFEVV